MKSWRTTIVAALALIVAVCSAGIALLDGDPSTGVDSAAVLAALTSVGFLLTRDNKVTSEKAGLKKWRPKSAAGIVLLCFGLSGLMGCNTFGLPGAQSKAVIQIRETTFDEFGNKNTFDLNFKGQGDAEELLQGLQYEGDANGAWKLTVDQDVAGLASPGALEVSQAYAELARTAPALADAILPYLNQPEAPSALQSLLGLVGSVLVP